MNYKLENGDVHIWSAIFDTAKLEQLEPLLSADERERAARFHFDEHRARYVFARGVLRSVLAEYLQLPPRELIFRYSEKGKPSLANGGPAFNLSHSRDLTAIGVTRGRDIGIDVEFARENFPGLEVAEKFFTPRECASLRELQPEAQRTLFFQYWTAKEAFLKAIGEGFYVEPSAIEVAFLPDGKIAIQRLDSNDVSPFCLRELKIEQGYFGAVACSGSINGFNSLHWNDEFRKRASS